MEIKIRHMLYNTTNDRRQMYVCSSAVAVKTEITWLLWYASHTIVIDKQRHPTVGLSLCQ